mmetsp:Transcript_11156/g.32249  ORF Transcript_11156/g.32249 Transcript_11156/m.32249 type:complete len:81 (+) Transcript_11156:246-488(+)
MVDESTSGRFMKSRLVHDIDHMDREDMGLDSLQIDVATIQAAHSIKWFHDEISVYRHQHCIRSPSPPGVAILLREFSPTT